MRKLPPLAALRALEAAGRHLSFKRAAEELAVTPTAISHQIRLLEATLGQTLFERRARRVALTPAGQKLYPTLRDSFDAMAQAVAAVRVQDAGRAVTLTATLALTSMWLVPRVAAFRARFPDIGLRLLASDDVVDLGTGAADIAVRYGKGPYPGCRSELLLQGRFAPVCSPGLGLRTADDLARHALIHFEWRHMSEHTPLWPNWFAAAGRPYSNAGGEIVFSDETHAVQAAAAGQGVVLASLALVANAIASGLLAAPFGPVLDGAGFHVVTPDHLAGDAKVTAVREWLVGEAAAVAGTITTPVA
ncbi:LysR substrate-binding domain-containing protein [Phreatobacter stygius]|uniref:LysR family transcriptional regulator n=1 Tax=Phreatobacter stygius TaxID=1940610 RepID=A0A4D7B9D2_9HYPH|nr:LysR substrate-binding domain-containing protein [Phreatobacter stygius]QCI67130.1 LysR family transcriptional regulator [Phreatobacter stygius]